MRQNVLVKIYTSEESNQSVNMNKAEDIGVKQMIEFQDDLPGTFREPLITKVVLMTSGKDKQAKRNVNKDEYNTDFLLARVLLSLGTNQPELDQAFSCKLAPVSTSLFRE